MDPLIGLIGFCTVMLATLYVFGLALLLSRLSALGYRIDAATRDLLEAIELAKEDVLEVRRWSC